MGYSIIDYLKCDSAELNFRILVLTGYWPLDTDIKWLRVLHSIFCYICSFSITSMLFIQILDIYLLRNDYKNLVTNLSATSITFLCVVKNYLTYYKIESIQTLHRELDNSFNKYKRHPDNIEILENAFKQIARLTKLFYGLGIPCVTVWMLYPGLDNNKDKKIPFPYRLPVDDYTISPIYEILYIYQSMSMIGFLTSLLSSDIILMSFMIRIGAQYDILMKNLRTINEMTNLSNISNLENEFNDRTVISKVNTLLRKNLKLHQIILREIDQVKDVYSAPAMVFFLGAGTMLCVVVVDIIVITKGFQLRIVQEMFYLMCGLFDIFMWCQHATSLQDKSSELAKIVYEIPWYAMRPSTRRDFLMILKRLKKPPILKIGNMFTLGLGTFLDVIKTTYNLSALLYQTVRK